MARLFTICALLFFVAHAPLSAREFSAKGAEWNNLSHALDITPFYFTLKDKAEARSLALEIDVYRDGKLIKNLSGGSLSRQEPAPIDFKSAVFFLPGKDAPMKGVITAEKDGDSSKVRFTVPLTLFLENGMICSKALLRPDEPIVIPGRTPLYLHVHAPPTQACSLGPDWQETLKTNPGATIFVFFLKAE